VFGSKLIFNILGKRQYTKRTVFDAHLSSRKHIKAAEALKKEQANMSEEQIAEIRKKAREQEENKRREIAMEEAIVRKYAEVLAERREATRANVERKQALTEHERQVGGH
jgi:splicing factor 3A subunit 3